MGSVCAQPKETFFEAPVNEAGDLSEYGGSSQFYSIRPDSEGAIRYARSGQASQQVNPARTTFSWLKEASEKHGDKPALKVERPCPELVDGVPPAALPEEQWLTWSWSQYWSDVNSAAKGFIKLGLQRHDSVNVWGFNAPEWTIAAHAAPLAGGKVAGLYPTDTEETAAFKVVHSGGSIVVVEDRAKMTKLQAGLAARGDAKKVKAIIAYGFDPAPGGAEKIELAGCGSVPIYGWKELIKMGEEAPDAPLEMRINDIRPGHCCCLIYTSGTTGDPKAVMISHDNIAFESGTFVSKLRKDCSFAVAEQERVLSYLPLSHVAGMMIDIVCPVIATCSPSWSTVYFARNYDLKVGAIKDRLQVARPTIFLGVPLVWEKIADKIRAIGAANTGVKKAMGDWAKGLALENSRSKQLGEQIVAPTGLSIALSLLGKVKANLGLDTCKYCMTGAAPIRVDTLEYYGSLGMTINEVYGMSECTGAATYSSPQIHEWGSCGYELSGVEVKAFKVNEVNLCKKTECPRSKSLTDVSEECQGELCYRGRNIMMGYMCQPDLGAAHIAEIEKKNSDAIDGEGWLHSGDKGMITQAGMAKITGRYKELIIGAGGENIAPVPIEDHVKKECDGICDIMMVGDKRKYNVALVTLKAVGANGEVPGTDKLDAGAARLNPAVTTIAEAMKDKVWIDKVTAAITSANNNGKVCLNNSAQIQKFSILPTNFSEAGGELTPTKKLKRAVVLKIYHDIVEKMYNTNGVYIEFSN